MQTFLWAKCCKYCLCDQKVMFNIYLHHDHSCLFKKIISCTVSGQDSNILILLQAHQGNCYPYV